MDNNRTVLIKYVKVIFGILFVTVSVLKLQLTHSQLSASFYVVESISYLLIVGFVFYLDSQLKSTGKLIKHKDIQMELMKDDFVKKESLLLAKIMKLEEKEQEELQFTINKEKTVNKILHGLNSGLSIEAFSKQFLISLSKSFEIAIGIFYSYSSDEESYCPIARYAIDDEEGIKPFQVNDGFCGQAVADRKIITVTDVPEDYFIMHSGLGNHVPLFLYFIPVTTDNEVPALIEIGTFKPIEISRIWGEINNKLIDLLKLHK